MPIYQYECSECGARFEMKQHFGDAAPAQCPNGHNRVRRRLSSPIIIYKGSGFYSTDHGKNGSALPSAKKPEKSGSESETKTEAKPEPAAKSTKASSDSDS